MITHSLYAVSQTEDFFTFLKKFSFDTTFQYTRIQYPLEVITWDYENDNEVTININKNNFSLKPIINLNSDCADGFYFVFPNMEIDVKEFILEIKGITDASEKYWFSVVENKWFLVRYRNFNY